MRAWRCASVLAGLLIACGQSQPGTIPSPTAAVAPATAPVPTAAAEPALTPLPPPPASPSLPPIAQPDVAIDPAAIPIVSTRLTAVPVTDERMRLARGGVERYLMQLDWYREGASALYVPGRFGEAVKRALADSATQGVKRKFALISISVERFLEKPWGIPALADVTVTIVDRAVDGNAPDQRETGRLRLTGDRLRVSDGWDHAMGRWYNGPPEIDERSLRSEIASSLAWFFATETWRPGATSWEGFGGQVGPFWKARDSYVAAFDRSKITSRTFAGLKARVTRFDRFDETDQGLLLIGVSGQVVLVDAAGRESREPFSRQVLVLKGNWTPEVADEEIGPGLWRSGGTAGLYAGLKERDRNFA